jgi:hypothetical protein
MYIMGMKESFWQSHDSKEQKRISDELGKRLAIDIVIGIASSIIILGYYFLF